MIIVHIITRLYKGGAEENTLLSCLHQVRQGHEVHLLYGPDNLTLDRYKTHEDQVGFHLIPSLRHRINPKDDLKATAEMVQIIRKLNPDIVHTHTSKAGILGRVAAKIAGVKAIIHGVHILPFCNVGLVQKAVYLTVEHFTALFTHLFVHVSNGTQQAYANAKIGKKKPHAVVYSGMDVEKFKKTTMPANWHEILRASPSMAKPKVILMLAALEGRKRQLPFLEGFAKATNKGDNIRLVFAGDGQDRSKIERRITELDLEDRVVLLGHYPKPEELAAIADIGVLSSLREGLPRVVVQYIAAGCPAVVSPVDGIDEVVTDGVNGIIIQSQSAEDVAIAAVNLLTDDETYQRLKTGAAMTDVSPWSFDSMFSALDESYDMALQRCKKRSEAA